MPFTPGGKIPARIVGNPTIRRLFGFDLPPRDVRWAGIEPGMRVLEIGAGRGLYTRALLQAVGPTGSVVSLEYSEEAARILAKELESARVVVADARLLPIRQDQRFDALCCFYSIEEIPDNLAVAAELARFVIEGGLAILFFWRPLCGRRKRCSILDVLRLEGFTVEAEWSDLQNVRVVLRKSSLTSSFASTGQTLASRGEN